MNNATHNMELLLPSLLWVTSMKIIRMSYANKIKSSRRQSKCFKSNISFSRQL